MMRSWSAFPCLLLAGLLHPVDGQSQPPVCQVVTSDQVGADGQNTAAIQQQLDSCGTTSAAQSSVELSASNGGSFASGPLYIPSNVVLWLDAGVTLHASTNPGDFQRTVNSRTRACDSTNSVIPSCGTLDSKATGCTALISSCKTTNAGVGGPGVIEGHGWSALTGGPNTGTSWWTLAGAAKAGGYVQSLNAPKMIDFEQSNNFFLSGFTIQNAPLVHILLGKDSGATVSQLHILTPTPDHTGTFPYNSDGMDISGSMNVQVDGADFSDGDDNIALEGGGNGRVSTISVTNSVFRLGHGLSIGSPTSSGVTNLIANNIRFIGTDNGLRIKTDSANGGIVDQIKYGTICMSGVKNAVVIDPYYSSSRGSLIPMFKNVEIDGMWADGGNVTVIGYSGQPPVALTLNNVLIDTPGKVIAANANITELFDPNFAFPVAIPNAPDVVVTPISSAAAAPVDIKSYCQAALGQAGATGASTTNVDDTFADGNSQNQDLAHNSFWLFNGRANNTRTDQVGSVTFDVTPAGTSSEAFWAYFTDAGSPIVLGVGDKLTVGATFSLSGFKNNGQDIRWGVLDSQGTRNTGNLTGGMNDATFVNDTGYGLQFAASGTGNPFVIGRRSVFSNANVFNNFGDFTAISGSGAMDRQALVDNTPYTLTYTIERLSDTDTRLSTAVTGGALSGLNYSAVESSANPNTSFDYFAFRIGGTNFTSKISFSEFNVQYNPAAPTITSQPQPASLTVQVGGNVTLAVGAKGNQISYHWQNNGQPILGNSSANTPTLILTNVKHSDAGSYTAAVTNAGGSVMSDPAVLNVSDTAVAPLPAIATQPVNTTVTLASSTGLSVKATGDNLIYQWFKNGVLIPGAAGAQLAFSSAQVSDSASYTVIVSNSSGSVTSAPATLLVVSAMAPTGFRPWNQQTAICVDTPLYIAFNQTPRVGKTGRVKVYNSRGVVVDTIDMTANPQSRVVGGAPFAYYPVIVTGNVAAIYLHQQLPYNDTYSVTMDPGVVLDPNGAPFAGFSSTNLWTFTTQAVGPVAGANALTVAFDGGDFCTVQGAIDFVPANNTQPVAITVRGGSFTGIEYVPANKPFIAVRGEDRDNTVLQYANNNNLNPSVSSRAMFGVDASDFTLENITLYNTTPHGGSQAEAFRGNNKRILLNRVTLKSFQDTLMLQGAAMVTDSYIEGDVDFMWGAGAVYFNNCELKALTSGGYYTQIRNSQGQAGNVYANCRLTSGPGVADMYLGRIDPAVYPYSQVVFINTAMGPQISPVGWLLNNATVAPNTQFGEFQSTDLNGAPLDVSKRLAGSRQISADEAAQWSDPAFALGGWVPFTVNTKQGAVAAGATLTVNWSAATGHSAKDWVGLFAVEAQDTNFISMQFTGGATTGHLSFAAPAAAGQYEFRYFLSDGVTRAASGNKFAVQ